MIYVEVNFMGFEAAKELISIFQNEDMSAYIKNLNKTNDHRSLKFSFHVKSIKIRLI